MRKKTIIVTVVAVAVAVTAIAFIVYFHKSVAPQIPSNLPDVKDTTQFTMEDFNKLCIADENAEIAAFVDSVGGMTRGEEGYWYRIVEEGKGRQISKGDVVRIAYAVELLDGTRCYSSDRNGEKTYKVGQRQVERGLDVATPLFKAGTEAEIVIPSFLAHGVVGDRNMIPSRTPILYRIKIIEVK